MFFLDDNLGGIKRRAALKEPPAVPETGWRAPGHFPNLSSARILAVDVETKEPDFAHGPGWSRGVGHIVGISLAAVDAAGNRESWYFPVRHEYAPETNLDPIVVFAWLKTVLETPDVPKVGANLLYDVGWLTTENIYVQGELHDVQFAEALLREEGEVSLEYLGQKYLHEGKTSELLYAWCADAFGGSVSSDQRGNIYRAPAVLVGPYAQSDADLPLRVLEKQRPLLENEGLWELYRMECDLIYLLTRMRLTGVRVDLSATEQLQDEIKRETRELHEKLHKETGVWANVNSGADLAKVFDAAGIAYNRTVSGKPSFTKEYLNTVEHPIADLIRAIRERDKLCGTFLRAYLLESNVAGRVHCQFHPLRGGSGGTRSGRFASSSPNLQNIPSRSTLGKRVRKLFVPDHGHVAWEKVDYSQIEYRFLAHFAVGDGADGVRQRYAADPNTDYHVLTQELVKTFSGFTIDRKPIKNINFGLLYGMGEPKLARQIGVAKDVAKQIFKAYHAGNPYVKATMDAAAHEAESLGYVSTIMGRRSRFDYWEPRVVDYDERATPLPYNLALRNYGADIRRAHTHKAVNRKLQGSAADLIKMGMHRCWKEGVFDVIGVPKLQVHDELDFSVAADTPAQNEAYAYMRHVLETAIPLRIPVLVDAGRGSNWGSID